jgi:hypothetical protein
LPWRQPRWLTPQGETIVAPLPNGIRGHFGPELRRFVLMQHYQSQVTVERLVVQLQAVGVSISKRQVMRLLIDRQDAFLGETREVLRAGLETANWVTVDDTGARHRGASAVCTQIGNDRFAWFGTTGSKSRLNMFDQSYSPTRKRGTTSKAEPVPTTISNSRIQDQIGTASYSIDLPNGGNATIQDNTIEQGKNSALPISISLWRDGQHPPWFGTDTLGQYYPQRLDRAPASCCAERSRGGQCHGFE